MPGLTTPVSCAVAPAAVVVVAPDSRPQAPLAGVPTAIPIAMGIAVGTPANGACGRLSGATTTTAAGATAQLTGVVSPGMLCVEIFDVGNQTAAVTYTVT